tara:strand:- start:3339 stop:5141 length:1803 start_codon:yes stop_codon:yes gene_type:complete
MNLKENLLNNKPLAAIAVLFGLFVIFIIWGTLTLLFLGKELTSKSALFLFDLITSSDTSIQSAKAYEDSATLTFFSTVILIVLIFGKGKNQKLHGDARFGNKRDLKKLGWVCDNGFILGRKGGDFIAMPIEDNRFVLVIAPTRRGKGVSLIIPNLLNWPQSVVVSDIKLENFKLTSGFRKAAGQEVYLINLGARDGHSHCWNPLDYISDNENFRVSDIDRIASMLIKGKGDDIWVPEARTLFRGIVLLLIELGGEYPITLGEVYRQNNTVQCEAEYFKEMVSMHKGILSTQCQMALMSYATNADKTRKGIKSQLNSSLSLFASPVIDAITSKSDFNFADLRKRKITVYMGTPPNQLASLDKLLALFWEQLISVNTENEEHDVKCLLLMDEFAALGRLESIERSIGYIASYGLKLCPILQSRSQLVETYSEHVCENFMENHAVWVVMTPRTITAAELIANEIGNITTKTHSKGKSTGEKSTSYSKNESEAKRHLILPQELKKMGDKKSLLLIDEVDPIYVERLKYYKMPEFQERLLPPITASEIEIVNYSARGVISTDGADYEMFDDFGGMTQECNIDPQQEVYTDEEIERTASLFLQQFN